MLNLLKKKKTTLNETLSNRSQGKEKDRWQTDPVAPSGRLEIADGNGNYERAGYGKVAHLETD